MARFRFPSGSVCRVSMLANGLEVLALLDTGADYVCLPRQTLRLAGAQPVSGRHVAVAPVGQSRVITRVQVYRLDSVEALGCAATNVEAIPLELPERGGYDGLLGVSFLRHFHLEADYGAGWVELIPTAAA